MHDFSTYYCFCYSENYVKNCKRVHFFNETFENSDFENLFNDSTENEELIKRVKEAYLGFIVIKRLPHNIIGKTVLKVYEDDGIRKRKFPVLRKYKINLFGINIRLNSLAFQEQDKVLSACATSALWSTFQKTSRYFQTSLPTPSELTKSAGNSYHHSGRNIPSQGLEVEQICRAIEKVGLVSELRNKPKIKNDNLWLKAFLYAYNRLGLPILVGIYLEAKFEKSGHHLITVVGYKKMPYNNLPKSSHDNEKHIRLYSDYLERFYAHDDQIGPFSRLGFCIEKDKHKIITAWWEKNQKDEKIRAITECLIVPLYHKIRIPFETIYKVTLKIDEYLDELSINKNRLFPNHIIWDIFLETSNKYKSSYYKINDEKFPRKLYNFEWVRNQIENTIFEPMPRFIWISRAIVEGYTAFDIIFDATEIIDGDICLKVIFFIQGLKSQMSDLLNQEEARQIFIDKLGNNIYEKFTTEL